MTNDMSRALARQEAELNDAAIAIIRDIAGGAREDRPSGFREAACRDLAVQLADVIEYRKEVEAIRLIHLAALDRSREYLEARYPHLDLPELDYPRPGAQQDRSSIPGSSAGQTSRTRCGPPASPRSA